MSEVRYRSQPEASRTFSQERRRERMAGVSERVVDHLESMEADEILSHSSQVEKIDTVARRTFGLDNPVTGSGTLNLNVLTGRRAIVQINQKNVPEEK